MEFEVILQTHLSAHDSMLWSQEGRGGFSAQLAYMIQLTELSSLHCTATHTSVSVSVFRVRAVADQH